VTPYEAVKGKKSEISQTIRYQGSNAVFGIVLKNIPPTLSQEAIEERSGSLVTSYMN
jgi:hypothetical protein